MRIQIPASSSHCLLVLWRLTSDPALFFEQKEPRAWCYFKGCLGFLGPGAGPVEGEDWVLWSEGQGSRSEAGTAAGCY